ncbi:MAG: class I SAM-dependent methyltransferase [Parvularculaceae bacterium]
MTPIAFLKRARERTLDRWPSASDAVNVWFSGTTYALWRAAKAPTADNAKGLVLDAGSGRGGWKSVIEGAGAKRETLDIAPKKGEAPDWVADLTGMPQVPSGRFDAAICHQVLEHVPRPHKALAELARVLKPGGALVLSVPHLSRLHELPHDYFRYTESGLGVLLDDAGLKIESIEAYGGTLTFIHHQFSTLFLGVASLAGPLYPVFVALNAPLSLLAVALDRMLDPRGMAPTGYVCVARKAGAAPGPALA